MGKLFSSPVWDLVSWKASFASLKWVGKEIRYSQKITIHNPCFLSRNNGRAIVRCFMTILFIGQRGIPILNTKDAFREQRVEALAQQLGQAGHIVTVTCARPFITTTIKRLGNVTLQHHFSLNPEKPGGWIYLLLTLYSVWKQQPDVVHMHGWKAAALVRVAAILSPLTTFVWTVENIPSRRPRSVRFILWQAKGVCDVITTPYRDVQYRLWREYGMHVEHVPDGYAPSSVPAIHPKRFGLKAYEYAVALVHTAKQARWVAKASTRAKLTKPLVTIEPGSHGQRALASLIMQARVVILAGDAAPTGFLYAMASGRPIIATAQPRNIELGGVTAHYIQPGDSRSLVHLLKGYRRAGSSLNVAAQRRAANHFTWKRIAAEYLSLYRSVVVRSIPMDSAIASVTSIHPALS